MEILILGAGVVGTTTAYQLLKDGHHVNIIDRNAPAIGGASFGNAGLIATGHTMAWASPKALKIWINSSIKNDPVFRMKFQLNTHFIDWGIKFLGQCTKARAKKNSLAKHFLSKYSQKKLNEVAEETGIKFERNTKGLIYLYRTPKKLSDSYNEMVILRDSGQKLEMLDKKQTIKIVPELADSKDIIAGSIFSPTDESGDSRIFTEKLMDICKEMGCNFESDVSIERIDAIGSKINRVVTNKGIYKADIYVLCLGAWSPLLVQKSLGVKLSIYPVKGYSVTIPVEKGNTPPSLGGLHEEDLLGFSPMGDHFRISSVSEFTGYDTGHTPEDFAHILKTAKILFPNAGNYEKAMFWSGLRPMTPEGVPVLGKGKHSNLFYNTGHGHLGWTMSCGTARLTADLISGEKTEIPIDKMKFR